MTINPKSGNAKLMSGAVNYFGLHFEFDEEFAAIPGAKAVEFYKNRCKFRVDLVDGSCTIPNEILADKANFEMRVVSGSTIGTIWASVGITESGVVMPEEPSEEAPVNMEYVKTASGDKAVPYLQVGTNGLEYSQDGENWNSGVSGVPEVPKTAEPVKYLRANGDWIPYEEPEQGSGEANIIEQIQVNGTALEVVDKAVNIDLSDYAKTADIDLSPYAKSSEIEQIYAKTADIENTYAKTSEVEQTYAKTADIENTYAKVEDLDMLQGTASVLTTLDESAADTAAIAAKVNEIISVLQARGVATE